MNMFDKKHCVVLFSGDSVLLPLCHVPMVVGVPCEEGKRVVLSDSREKPSDKATTHAMFAVSMPFDKAWGLHHSYEATKAASDFYVDAGSKIPPSIRDNAIVKEWLSTLQERKPEKT